ncbi:16208_t:CDS:2, partial [Racocetra fulgida]
MSEIKSAAQLENEIKKIQETFQVKETEHTWQLFDDALKRLASLTTELVEEIGRVLGPKFDTLAESFVPAILKLCTRANKIFINRAQKCMMTIIRGCHIPNLIPKFKEALQGQSKILRTCASEFVLVSIEVNEVGNLNNYIADLEWIIREGAIDSAPAVRATSKKILEIYKVKFDLRLEEFVNTLSSNAKKNLGIQEPASNHRPRIKALQKSRKYNTQQMQDDVIIYMKNDENVKDKKTNVISEKSETIQDDITCTGAGTNQEEKTKASRVLNTSKSNNTKPTRPPLPSRTINVPVVGSNKTKPMQTSTNKKRSAPLSSYKPPLVKESKAAINSIPKPSKVTATATSTAEGLTTTATISVTKDRQYTPYEKPAIGFATRKYKNRIPQDSSELSAKLNAYANKIIEELTGQRENNEDSENITLELIPKLEEQIFETNTQR